MPRARTRGLPDRRDRRQGGRLYPALGGGGRAVLPLPGGLCAAQPPLRRRATRACSDLKAPRSAAFNEADSGQAGKDPQLPRLAPKDLEAIDTLYRRRAQSLQAVDEAVATVVDALKAAGQLDNTYVFFTSDNGFHMGQHRLKPGKDTPTRRTSTCRSWCAARRRRRQLDQRGHVERRSRPADRRAGGGGAPVRGRRPLVRAPAAWARERRLAQVVLLEQFEFLAETIRRTGVLEPRSPGREPRRLPFPPGLADAAPEVRGVRHRRAGGLRLRRDPEELNPGRPDGCEVAGADVEPGPGARGVLGGGVQGAGGAGGAGAVGGFPHPQSSPPAPLPPHSPRPGEGGAHRRKGVACRVRCVQQKR